MGIVDEKRAEICCCSCSFRDPSFTHEFLGKMESGCPNTQKKELKISEPNSERATLHLSSSNSIQHLLDTNFHVILIAQISHGVYFHHPIDLVYDSKSNRRPLLLSTYCRVVPIAPILMVCHLLLGALTALSALSYVPDLCVGRSVMMLHWILTRFDKCR